MEVLLITIIQNVLHKEDCDTNATIGLVEHEKTPGLCPIRGHLCREQRWCSLILGWLVSLDEPAFRTRFQVEPWVVLVMAIPAIVFVLPRLTAYMALSAVKPCKATYLRAHLSTPDSQS